MEELAGLQATPQQPVVPNPNIDETTPTIWKTAILVRRAPQISADRLHRRWTPLRRRRWDGPAPKMCQDRIPAMCRAVETGATRSVPTDASRSDAVVDHGTVLNRDPTVYQGLIRALDVNGPDVGSHMANVDWPFDHAHCDTAAQLLTGKVDKSVLVTVGDCLEAAWDALWGDSGPSCGGAAGSILYSLEGFCRSDRISTLVRCRARRTGSS